MLAQSVFSFFASIVVVSVPPIELLSQNHDFLIRQLKSESSDLKINSLDRLGELKNPLSIPSIAENLQDPDPEVRYHAIRALSKSPLPEALAALQDRVPQGQPAKESDPYLAAEIRRGVKSTEDLIKANAEAAEISKLKASEHPSPKNSKVSKKPRK